MDQEVAFYVKNVENRKTELENSSWLHNVFLQADTFVKSVDEIRCLALGSVSDYVNPRFQLAFMLLLAARYDIKRMTAWDPIFSKSDKLVLAHFGIEINEANPSSESILWYIPHGPFTLILDLVPKLGHNVYIGNDLSSFSLEDKSSSQKETIERYKSEAVISPIRTDKHDRWNLAFSTTALHKLH